MSEDQVVVADGYGVDTTSDESTLVLKTRERDITATIKAYRCIYDQITGKPQKITTNLRYVYELSFPQLDQLNIKIDQILKTYNVIARNCMISVFHDGNDKEDFPSYELFSRYNISNNSAIDGIVLNYNFTVIDQEKKNVQNYVVSVKFTPNGNIDTGMPRRYRYFGRFASTIAIEVEYNDYVIARTISGIVTDWAKTIKIKDISKAREKVERLLDYFPIAMKIIYVCVIFYFLNKSGMAIGVSSLQQIFELLVKYGFIGIIGFMLLNEITDNFPSLMYSFWEESTILINEGDKQRKEKNMIEKRKGKMRTVFYVIGNLFINILAGVICKYILV